ncbi:MAG: exosortase/archaeosortase family protein [Chloroflexota bacterium]|nr:exosortase/archaeosortase family protein [Chloroflexota bacterium]
MPPRFIAVVGIVILAYPFSMFSLAKSLTLQTPLAFLGLVPPIALVLGWIRIRREPPMRPIHDRQVDYIIGLAFLGAAVAIASLMPLEMGPTFWLYRVDLLTLPLFVAGLIALFYGTRHLWALRFPIAFLLLAWPAPYLLLVNGGERAWINLTVRVLALISGFLPYATPIAGGADVFSIRHATSSFFLGVGSISSGVNSIVGFAIIGGAVVYVADGARIRRIAWLIAYLALVWTLDVIHIEAVFVTGAVLGQRAALGLLHPVAGVIPFSLATGAALLALRPFGMRFRPTGGRWRWAAPAVPIHRVYVVAALTCLVAIWLFHTNAGYARYAPGNGPLGDPQLGPFTVELGWGRP